MIPNAIQRKAVQLVRPGLGGSSGRRTEPRSRSEPVCFDPERDHGCLNQLEYHRVGDQDVEKSDELYVVGKGSGRAKTTRIRQERYNAEKQPVFWAVLSCLV